MEKICAVTGRPFEITEEDLKFYEKLGVPLPTLCVDERHRRKMAFRNERFLYKKKCALCGKEVISMFQPESPYTVYCNQCWWGDAWDPLKFGQDFDFTRPFFEQFSEVNLKVPKNALNNFDQENSEYCNFSCHNKDSYMLFGSWFNERCMYGNTVLDSFEVNDSIYANKCKHSYEIIDCEECYELFYSQNCKGCSSSYFLFDCKSCKSCIFCWNLRNKEYHIFNKPVSREEYEKTLAIFQGSYEKICDALDKFKKAVKTHAIHKYMEGEQNENCVGNFLYRCKNAIDVFYGLDIEDVRHSVRTTKGQKDSMDINGNSGGELMYDSIHMDFCHKGKFSLCGEHNTDFAYVWDCYQCEEIFGCAGLRHKRHCILNKQYSKEDYFKLLPKIIEHVKAMGEWGEFFPMKLSPFAYNETIAQEYYPLTKEEAEKKGAKWMKEAQFGVSAQTYEIPDNIADISTDILEIPLTCQKCGKNYRIIKQELEFYKKYKFPIPRTCFSCRHMERFTARCPYKSFERACTNCGRKFLSSYNQERGISNLYCEKCYLEAVY